MPGKAVCWFNYSTYV